MTRRSFFQTLAVAPLAAWSARHPGVRWEEWTGPGIPLASDIPPMRSIKLSAMVDIPSVIDNTRRFCREHGWRLTRVYYAPADQFGVKVEHYIRAAGHG